MGFIGSKPWKEKTYYNSNLDLRASYGRPPLQRRSSVCDFNRANQFKRPNPMIGKKVHVCNGTIEIRSGDITKERVNAIVISMDSPGLRNNVLRQAGDLIKQAYESGKQQQPDKSISTNGGNLPCQRIYFIPCPKLTANTNEWTFRNFIKEAVQIAANDHSSNIQSLAFPAIGCGLLGCKPYFVAKALVRAVAYEFRHQPSLRFHVSFIIQSNQQHVLDTFCDQLATIEQRNSANINPRLPPITPHSPSAATPAPNHRNLKFTVEKRPLDQMSNDYKMVMQEFTSTMPSTLYSTIVRIELVWNGRWYKEYMIHKAEFSQRLKQDTEKLLFHGCPESAANNIINGCFDRRYAGQHGTSYGEGSYFSSKASYSHSYAAPNSNGERCMFLARVLVGKTTVGNSTMKVCPAGYDTTTDGSHIYVIYHDSQAFGNYLITYK